MPMELKHLLWRYVVLGEGPLHVLHLFGRKVREQDLIALDFETSLLHIVDLELFAIVDGIVRIADQLEPHVVSVAETTRALGCDGIVLILDHLIAQEREGNIVQLEVVQIVLPTHVQKQVNSKASTDR